MAIKNPLTHGALIGLTIVFLALGSWRASKFTHIKYTTGIVKTCNPQSHVVKGTGKAKGMDTTVWTTFVEVEYKDDKGAQKHTTVDVPGKHSYKIGSKMDFHYVESTSYGNHYEKRQYVPWGSVVLLAFAALFITIVNLR